MRTGAYIQNHGGTAHLQSDANLEKIRDYFDR